jgi:tetratricopeptide (TPR) repeat protein
MAATSVTYTMCKVLFLSTAVCAWGQTTNDADTEGFMKQGKLALAQNRLRDAAIAFQKAVDLNPSSAQAHEGLGVALSREIIAGNVRPSAESDAASRAENHLKQAIELQPSSSSPLLQLSELEASLAERAPDPADRSGRYREARGLLKRVLDLEPGKAGLYLRLANLERDEFGPAIQQAKARAGKESGPLSDLNARHALQKQYGGLLEDAITNAQRASELNSNSAKPLLLLSQMLKERALLRDTQEQYAGDMRSAEQWRLQFLAVGGHLEQEDTGLAH